jgi:tripartite-type tricarboxylate transporter receptor subunit TctC
MRLNPINSSILMYRYLASVLSLLLVIFMLTPGTFAASYPDRPVRWVVPGAPGGGTDNITRYVANKLAPILGQPIVVENRTGASGNIGAEYVARSKPDGYTILTVLGSHTSNAALLKKIPFDLERDFTPITMMTIMPLLLTAHPSLPARDIQELIVLAKSKPGYLQYASSGVGSMHHMAMELFQIMTATKMQHIPYKSTNPAVIDLLGGHVPLACIGAITTLPHVRAGKLRSFGMATASRMKSALDIPTIAEQGVPGYQAANWAGVLAPAGTPTDIVTKLYAGILKSLHDPEVEKYFQAEASEVTPSSSPEEFGALIRTELAKWSKVVQAAGIQQQ